jgi:hypothetical protein
MTIYLPDGIAEKVTQGAEAPCSVIYTVYAADAGMKISLAGNRCSVNRILAESIHGRILFRIYN